MGNISDQGSKLEKWLTACEKTKRESSCDCNNAWGFIAQSYMQASKCFKAEACDFGHMTAQQQFKTELGWSTHRCWVSWRLRPFIPMHVLGDFRQFGHWVLTVILFMLYGRYYQIFILIQGSHKSQPSEDPLSFWQIRCRSWKIDLSSSYWTTDDQHDLLAIVLSLSQGCIKMSFCEICSVQMNTSMTITLTGSCAPCMKTCRLSYHTVTVDHVSVRQMYLHLGLKWDFIR